jgi:catechol 2,3-dioxygenase-like lactoylglutathione lyase family enzyme
MQVTDGIKWIGTCTTNFDETVAFFANVMGLPVTQKGVAVVDTQFARYAQIAMPNGVVLEVLEPSEAVRQLYKAPIVSITVDDVAQARRELEGRKIEFLTPIFDTKQGWAWTYFRAPDGNIYQIQGPYQA